MTTVYREIIAPFYFGPHCQQAKLKLAKLKILMFQIISLYKHNAFVRIQDKAKLLASVEERK